MNQYNHTHSGSHHPFLRMAIVVFLLGWVTNATAALFCVDSEKTLKNALKTAASRPEPNEIRIVQGSYVGNFVFTYQRDAHEYISIIGGYTSGCAKKLIDPGKTILDGGFKGDLLSVNTDASGFDKHEQISIENLTIQNSGGSALSIETGAAYIPNINVTGNIFKNNKGIGLNVLGIGGDGTGGNRRLKITKIVL